MTTDTLIERYNSLTDREKLILLATLAVGIWSAWDNFLYQPVSKQQSQLQNELATINAQLSAQQQAAIQIEAMAKTDPNQANKQKLGDLKVELKKLKQQLNSGDKKFVPAYLMAEVLQNMLKKNTGIKLIQLEKLPVTTLTESVLNKSASVRSWVYRHGLSLTLNGNYFNTLNYLKSLESLPWRFNWGDITYQVKIYPIAETKLRIYSLSFEENWLGL